jgi:hypothetical protein
MELPSSEIVKMRAFLRIQNRDQTWAYVERKKKEQYIRVAVKKLLEEDDEFQYMKPQAQLDAIVDRAKAIAIKEANDENEFVAKDAEGHILDEEGNPDFEAEDSTRPPRFGDGTPAEVGESREIGRHAGMAKPKTFG